MDVPKDYFSTHASGTTTLPAERHFLYTLRSDDDLEENYLDAINQLATVIKSFGNFDDKLSERLHEWARNWGKIAPKFYFEVDDNLDYTEAELCALDEAVMYRASADIGKQFEALRVLLRNNLTFEPSIVSAPLYDPQEDKVWDAADYHTFKRVSAPLCLSPYTNLPFKAEMHPFAKAILEWRERFFADVCCPEEQEPLVVAVHEHAMSTMQSQLIHALKELESTPNLPEDIRTTMLLRKYQVLAATNGNGVEMQKQVEILQKIYQRTQAENAQLPKLFAAEDQKNQAFAQQWKSEAEAWLKDLGDDYEPSFWQEQKKIDSLKAELAEVKRLHAENDQALLTLSADLQKALEEQAATEMHAQQQLRALHQVREAKVAQLYEMLSQEQQCNEARKSVIDNLKAEIDQAIADNAALEVRIKAGCEHASTQVQAVQAHLNSQTSFKQQLQAHFVRLQRQQDAATAQLAAQREDFESSMAMLKQIISAQNRQMIAQHSARRLQQLDAQAAELLRQQKSNQDEENLYLQTIQAKNQCDMTLNQNQIDILEQQKRLLQASNNSLQGRLTQLGVKNQQNSQNIASLENHERVQASAIQRLRRKAKSNKKWYKFW